MNTLKSSCPNFFPSKMRNLSSEKKDRNFKRDNFLCFSFKEEEIKRKCLEMKDISEKLHKANIQKMKENKYKDDEINKINEELAKIKLSNFELENKIEKDVEQRMKYETEQKKISLFCNELKHKFKNMNETIKNYEQQIKKTKESNQKLIEDYDLKIKNLEEENQKIDQRIDEKIKEYDFLKDQILENERKVFDLSKDFEVQKSKNAERALQMKIKFDTMEKLSNALQKKVNEMQLNYSLSVRNKINTQISSSINKPVSIEQQIHDYDVENEKLAQELEELNKEWESLKNNGDENNNSNTLHKTENKRNKKDNSLLRGKRSKSTI